MTGEVFLLFLALLLALVCGNGQNLDTHYAATKQLDISDGIFSQMIIRHGDRTPKITWPTDLHNKSSWPTGFGGQMTLKGKLQCFHLGKWIRSRYSESHTKLINGYHSRAIYIRSADIDRCIQCATTIAAGMFPPTAQEIVSDELGAWQPVSVHTIPAALDHFVGDDLIDCPAYDKAYDEIMHAEPFVGYQKDAAGLYANMSQLTGISVNGPKDAIKVRAELKVHKRNGLSLPDWAHYVLKNELFDGIAHLMLKAPTFNEQLSKLRVGLFLKEILDRATSIKDDQNSMYMYSAHGKTMANLLHTLNMLPDKKPGSASVLLFESFNFESIPYLRILYRNESTAVEPTPLFIPNCGWQCPIDKLYELYANVLPTETYEAQCAVAEKASKPIISGPFSGQYWQNLWKSAFPWW